MHICSVHVFLRCVTGPTTHSPSGVSSVKCRRSLQQNTVRDATQHGNTLQRRRQCGEGGVKRFFCAKTVMEKKVNCTNPPRKPPRLEWATRGLFQIREGAAKCTCFYREKSASRQFHRPLQRGSMARHTTCFMRTHFMTTVLCSTMPDAPSQHLTPRSDTN